MVVALSIANVFGVLGMLLLLAIILAIKTGQFTQSHLGTPTLLHCPQQTTIL